MLHSSRISIVQFQGFNSIHLLHFYRKKMVKPLRFSFAFAGDENGFCISYSRLETIIIQIEQRNEQELEGTEKEKKFDSPKSTGIIYLIQSNHISTAERAHNSNGISPHLPFVRTFFSTLFFFRCRLSSTCFLHWQT